VSGLQRVRAITLDLDDTLWPVWPAIQRAEAVLHAHLCAQVPVLGERFDIAGLRTLRDAVARKYPEWAHDFTRVRRHSIALALQQCGADPTLADEAFERFMAERNRVDLYEDVIDALGALSVRYPLLAVTNGNADLQRTGVGAHFRGIVSAREFGIGKPHPTIFAEACRRLGCEPAEVLHVGDDWALDIVGARAAGLHAAWLRRPDHVAAAEPAPAEAEAVWVIRHLGELVDRLVPAA
jgi:putative hydrolase of the HAD superfamily